MKDIKKFLIAALSFMLLVSVSCSNDNKTGSGGGKGEETTYNVVGDWHGNDGKGERRMITIKDDSSGVYYTDANDNTGTTIPAESITKGGNNTYTADIPSIGKATLKFTSDTTGTAKLNTTPEIPINKQ